MKLYVILKVWENFFLGDISAYYAVIANNENEARIAVADTITPLQRKWREPVITCVESADCVTGTAIEAVIVSKTYAEGDS